MPIHFWIWFLYFAIVIGGLWYGRAAVWFRPGILVALLGFAICWAVAGDPVHALIR